MTKITNLCINAIISIIFKNFNFDWD